ncbi:MAG: short-chain dehydrogenase [Desulfobulbaceae bacterium BRH_c16a]|nr:MAG: short-chain dehydrogenase [Desulfobulbaceae bacterium BRH_c16a]
MQSSKKRVALVTGANRGIGFAVASLLARKGLTVIIGARDEKNGLDAQKRMSGNGRDVHFTLLDVADPTSIIAAIGRIDGLFGRLDVLVNNAGILIDSETGILELSLGLLQNTLKTNTFGPLLLSQGCVPLMQKHDYGRIVNISSTLGSLTEIVNPDSPYHDQHSPAYRLSKTMLNAITALLAKELHGTNILVNSVCPGWVRTDLGGPRAPLLPEQAAETPVWLATLPDDGPTGGFFREHQPIPW